MAWDPQIHPASQLASQLGRGLQALVGSPEVTQFWHRFGGKSGTSWELLEEVEHDLRNPWSKPCKLWMFVIIQIDIEI